MKRHTICAAGSGYGKEIKGERIVSMNLELRGYKIIDCYEGEKE